MRKGLGWALGERLRVGFPWQNWRMARELGLNFTETIASFEEARRENEAKDWLLHFATLMMVLALVCLGFGMHSLVYAQFSAPAGFFAMFCLLFLRACYHHAALLARFQKRRGWLH